MDNKSIIIGILIVLIVVLGIGVFMVTSDQAPTNSTDNATNNTNNSTNGTGNITPSPSPTPINKNKTGKLLTAAQAIAIVKANAPDALIGTFNAYLTTYAGRPMYKVTYAVAQDIGYDTVSCYVDARTGTIYGEYQTISNNGGNNNNNNDNDNNNTNDNGDVVYY